MKRLRKLLRNQEGSATIEFVIWVFPFCVLLMLTVDVSMLYLGMTRMENAAREGARRLSVGQFDVPQIPAVVKATMTGDTTNIVVDATCSTTEYACVTVSRPVTDMAIFGYYLKPIMGDTFAAQTRMRVEPGVTLNPSPTS